MLGTLIFISIFVIIGYLFELLRIFNIGFVTNFIINYPMIDRIILIFYLLLTIVNLIMMFIAFGRLGYSGANPMYRSITLKRFFHGLINMLTIMILFIFEGIFLKYSILKISLLALSPIILIILISILFCLIEFLYNGFK